MSNDDLKTKYMPHLMAWVKAQGELPPTEEVEFYKSGVSFTSVKKGEFTAEPGVNCENVFFVAKGLFKVYYLKEDGQMFIRIFTAEGGTVSPHSAQLQGQPSDVFIEAIEDSIVASVPFKFLLELYDRHKLWERMGRLINQNLLIQREKRIYNLSLLDATDRYKDFLENHQHLLERISQADIARYLSITPVALSRIKKNL